MQKKGCWYSLYKCKLDRHFLRCARYFNLVCKNDTATNKKAERATTPVPPSPFVLVAQPSSSSISRQLAIWPRSDPDPHCGPGPSFALALFAFRLWWFSSQKRGYIKRVWLGRAGRGYGNFSAVEFLCENVKRLESRILLEKIPKSDAKNCNKNRNKRQMTAI